MRKIIVALTCSFAASLFVKTAGAYRPFDGTDADVAGPGEFELELGPVHWDRQTGHDYLIAPATVLNLGLLPRLELVIDFRNFWATAPVASEQRDRLLTTDVFLKYVIHRGVLQGACGPSVAVEAGPLTPEIGGDTRFGAHADVIISERGRLGAIHFNQQLEYTRELTVDSYTGVILEGPASLRIRPVSEFYLVKTLGGGVQTSALFGAIWTVSDSLAVDGAVRGGRADGSVTYEYRLGFTWTTRLWPSRESRTSQ